MGNEHASNVEKGFGVLPSKAPLANPYVPFQTRGAERYSADYALARGTLFQGLDLPLMGIVNEVPTDFNDLDLVQAYGFCMNELGLYLDTHSDDEEAVSLYNSYFETYEDYVEKYRQNSGALMQSGSTQSGKYDWLRSPWPWEVKKEGK